MLPPPPPSPLFPYTTLFRSRLTAGTAQLPPAHAPPIDPPLPRGERSPWRVPRRKPPCHRSRRRRKSSADRKSTRLNSSHVSISYAVFCLKKKINNMSLPYAR